MSSTILHESIPPIPLATLAPAEVRNPFLTELGQRVRALRERRGMTRKALATEAQVSERHLANLDYGMGNVSVLVLQQIGAALESSLAEMLGDVTTRSAEWMLIRALLASRDEDTLRRVRLQIAQTLGADAAPHARIALIGLRGAGKTTLGKMLAEHLGVPFVEISRVIEEVAGCSTTELQALYGMNAYRRHERRALEDTIAKYAAAVISMPGGLVSDQGSFNLMLAQCTTVWLQAAPEDHMKRVIAQGDMRPMAASKEAMEDLKGILKGREAFYSKASFKLDTSAQNLDETFTLLCGLVNDHKHFNA